MRTTKYFAPALVIAAALAGGGSVLVQHNAPASNFLCVGAGSPATGCDLAWANYSVESRYGDQGKVNCPKGSSTQPECYQTYKDSRDTSSRWGAPANTALIPDTTVGPATVGVYYGTGAADGRVWVGLCVAGAGCGSVAAGGGRNAAGDPFACATVFGSDGTDGHKIAGALAQAGISDDASDYETDGQVCGEVARGLT